MKIIIALFCCLGLIGCATVSKDSKSAPPGTENGLISIDQKELDDMIALFSEEIKRNPGYAGAYYNRAVAYYHKKDYDKSWQDVHKVQKLSKGSDPDLEQLVEKLSKASGRDK